MPEYHGYTASHNKDGSVTFNYTPTLPGTYKLTAIYNGQIPEGGELSCIVELTVEGYTTAYGPGDIDDLQNGVSIHRPEPDDAEVETDPFQAVLAATQEGTGELHLVEGTDADLALVHEAAALQDENKAALDVDVLVELDSTRVAQKVLEASGQTQSNVIYLSGDDLTQIKKEKSVLPAPPVSLAAETSLESLPDVSTQSLSTVDDQQTIAPSILEAINLQIHAADNTSGGNDDLKSDEHITEEDPINTEEDPMKDETSSLPVKPQLKDASCQTGQDTEPEVEFVQSDKDDDEIDEQDVEMLSAGELDDKEAESSDEESEKSSSGESDHDEEEDFEVETAWVPESPRVGRTPRRRGEFACEEPGCNQSFRFEYQIKKHKEAHARDKSKIKIEHKSPAKRTPFRIRLGKELQSSSHKKSTEKSSLGLRKPGKFIKSGKKPESSSDKKSDEVTNEDSLVSGSPNIKLDVGGQSIKSSYVKLERMPSDSPAKKRPQTVPSDSPPKKRPRTDFTCEIPDCSKSFPDRYKYERHMATHGDKQYQCDTPNCAKKYREKKSFIGHLQRHHKRTLNEDGIIVDYLVDVDSSKTETDTSQVVKAPHIKIKQEIQERNQDGDSQEWKSQEERTQEWIDARPCVCDVCSKRFKTKATLINHLAIHGIGKFNCGICKKTFPGREKLERHMHVHKPKSELLDIGDDTQNPGDHDWLPNTNGEINRNVKWQFECPHPVCFTRFKNQSTLVQHLSRMHGFDKDEAENVVDNKIELTLDEKEQERCVQCGMVCLDIKKLNQHMGIHDEKRPFECDKCPLTFRTATVLRNHMAVHGEGKVPCPACEKTFPSKIKLIRHLGNHPEELINYCQKCSERYNEGESEETHHCVSKNPPLPKPKPLFTCMGLEEGCGIVFKSKDKLCTHINRYHGSNPMALGDVEVFSCSQCPKLFGTRLSHDTHFVSHTDERPYICEFCATRFKLKGALRVHLREQHAFYNVPKEGDPEFSGDPLHPFLCKYCGKFFKRKSRLQQHVAVHESKEHIECPTCHKMYPTEFLMKEHHRTVHPVTDYRIVCPYEGCNKVLKGFYSYAAHKNIHENRRWNCTEPGCERHFSTRNSMKLHVDYFHKAVAGAFPCRVEGCGKAFKSRENLRFHKMTHVSERKFACEVCGKNFKTRVAVRVHAKIHYKDCHIQCAFCDKAFTRKNRLKEHMLKHKDALIFQEIVIDNANPELTSVHELTVPQELADAQELAVAQEFSTPQELIITHELSGPQKLIVTQELSDPQEMTVVQQL